MAGEIGGGGQKLRSEIRTVRLFLSPTITTDLRLRRLGGSCQEFDVLPGTIGPHEVPLEVAETMLCHVDRLARDVGSPRSSVGLRRAYGVLAGRLRRAIMEARQS